MLSNRRLFYAALLGLFAVGPSLVSGQDLPEGLVIVPEVLIKGIQPGDRVTLTLYTQEGAKLTDIGGERTVDSRGLLYLPFLEEVSVWGLSQTEVRELMDEGYEAFYANSVVEVEVKYRINVTGAVVNPAMLFLSPNATLTDAISEAGGAYSEVDIGLQGGAADASHVRLTRAGYDDPIIINFRPLESDYAVVNAPIQSGDWLHVPTAKRSQIREDLLFVGNILSVLIGVASLIIISAR
jgi:protein involved in polysaccharide export with SLBB domain